MPVSSGNLFFVLPLCAYFGRPPAILAQLSKLELVVAKRREVKRGKEEEDSKEKDTHCSSREHGKERGVKIILRKFIFLVFQTFDPESFRSKLSDVQTLIIII